MKTLSLKLADRNVDEAEEITAQLNLTRSRYINETVSNYYPLNKRKLLKKQLTKDSNLTMKDSLSVLHEFEKIVDKK